MEGSKGPDWRKNSGDSGILKTAEFESQFLSPSGSSRSNEYCPYSMRESQLSMEYRYDVLLIYDPEENSYYLDKLMEYLTPQDLAIFDLARDAPPGLPQRKVLQSALKVCRYTCIVITKKFISNFWLQLRTDMSIQDMLDNEEKMFSVIVVVMDSEVKKIDLPLDLATISPLFFTEKFFENRIKLAFSKTTPFPSLQPSSSFQQRNFSDKENSLQSSYANAPTARFDSGKLTITDSNSIDATDVNNESKGRYPCEHGDATFVMPQSIFPTMSSIESDQSSVMHRTISVTVGSTGCREPQEMADMTDHDIIEQKDQSSEIDSDNSSIRPAFLDHHMLESHCKLDDIFSPTSRSFREGNFSFQSQSIVEPNKSENHTLRDTVNNEFERPTFFSVTDPSFIITSDSVLTELEISEDSILHPPDESTSHSLPPNENIACSLFLKEQNTNLKLDDELSCSSLPAKLDPNDNRSTGQSLTDEKKARSMRSLFGSRLLRISRTLSFRQKKK